jgi:toxin ParE1/3/4
MARVLQSDPAREDLIQILVYLRERNPRAADRFEAELGQKCRTLAQFPLMGRSREELAAGLRSIVLKPYVVFYRPLDDGIELIRILHGKRDVPDEFD